MTSDDDVSTPELSGRLSPRISVVIPAHDEAAELAQTVNTIGSHIQERTDDWEILIIDDGSEDGTFGVVRRLAAEDRRVRGVRLSRNFGKEAALLCGLRAAQGAAVVTIDADRQQPPAIIPTMIDRWQDGAKIVHGVKSDRMTDSLPVRARARIFNGTLSRLAGVDLSGASDFKLLDRVVVDVLIQSLPERQRFYRGLAGWVGFPAAKVEYTVAKRGKGRTKWSTLRLADFAVTAIVSFTSAPLRIVISLGLMTLAMGLVVGADAVISWSSGRSVSGFATIIVTTLVVGSFIMISLGILGEYVAKIYDEIKRRPVYLVQETVGVSIGDKVSPSEQLTGDAEEI